MRIRWRLVCTMLGGLLGLLTLLALRPSQPGPPVAGTIRSSFLAVGDTGHPAGLLGFGSAVGSVGTAMAAEDRRRPARALVLLGDNFYPDGLEARDLVARVRSVLVAPFCHFVALDAARSPEVAGACPDPTSSRAAWPLLAILGNHDHNSPESPRLEREVVPRFVSNWNVPAGIVEVRQLEGGISLILLDSTLFQERPATDALVGAIEHAPGPWRILVSHHPVVATGPSSELPDSYRSRMLAALESARGKVQMLVSGHEHNLQLVQLDGTAPALQVVAGSGSNPRGIDTPDPDRRFGSGSPGFARIDLVDGEEGERLVASLYEVSRHARRYELVARYSVDRHGRGRDELAR